MQFDRRREMAPIFRQQPGFYFRKFQILTKRNFPLETVALFKKIWISITGIHQTEKYFAHIVLYTK
jgi:hypothetical protein